MNKLRTFLFVFLLVAIFLYLIFPQDILLGLMILFWLGTSISYKLKAKVTFSLALVLMIFCPLFVLIGNRFSANNLAVLTFIFLGLGTVQQTLELVFDWRKLNNFDDLLEIISRDWGYGRTFNLSVFLKELIKSFRGLSFSQILVLLVKKANQYRIVFYIILDLMALVSIFSLIIQQLKFAWWFYGAAYFKTYFPQVFLPFDLVWIVLSLLTLLGLFLLFRRRWTTYFGGLCLVLVVMNITLSYQNNRWLEAMAHRPVIFDVFKIQSETGEKALIKGAIFGEIEGKGSQVLFNGTPIGYESWTNSEITVPLATDSAHSGYFAPLQTWQVYDGAGSSSLIYEN